MESRYLTPGEEKLVEYLFKDVIYTRNVRIIRRPDVTWGGFTPLGSMRVSKEMLEDDYIGPHITSPKIPAHYDFKTGKNYEGYSRHHAHFFIHEMVHVWQHYCGLRVVLRGVGSRFRFLGRALRHVHHHENRPFFKANYEYVEDFHDDLMDYGIEQQAEIIADYYAYTLWERPITSKGWALSDYKRVLAKFMEDPAYPMKGRPGRRIRRGVRSWER